MYDTNVPNRFVDENAFRTATPSRQPLPALADVKHLLPVPFWDGHENAVRCYWRTWELAFGNLRTPAPGSGFVSNFIDTAFNGCLFMWDSSFILMFARYGARAFDFQQTLDNFYAKQHSDGFICREIREADGHEMFSPLVPASTGPNVMPWCEWEYFLNFGDRDRLARVFGPLLAYTQWFRKYRTWQDGTYFSSGWGCGMDNQPRLPEGFHEAFDHGFMSWIDTSCQSLFTDRLLLAMADQLGRASDVADIRHELDSLARIVNDTMWNDRQGFYVDRFRDGRASDVKSIGAYWAMLADVAPPPRLAAMIDHLKNPATFNRPHRVPTLSADHPAYDPAGGYWRGAIWAPTNYMILRGLTRAGQDALAHEIAANHLANVVAAFEATGTLWENYAPESVQGNCRRDFVGWTGLPPIAVLLEYLFGLRPDVPRNELLWDVRLTEAHGVDRYPFGPKATLSLRCAARPDAGTAPTIEASSTRPVTLRLRWAGGTRTLQLGPKGVA